jgi:hypothetical protein
VPEGALVETEGSAGIFSKLRFQQGVAGIRDYGIEARGMVA